MDYQKIDDNFIQEIRINLTISNFVDFKINNKNIVPEELTHIYLKKNFIIDQKILEHYYVHSQFLISNSEYSEKVNHGLMTPKWKLLEPYSIIIGNAYYSRIDLLTKLKTSLSSNYDLICGDKRVEYLSDLLPYFKEYSKGFEHGFNEFDNDQVRPFLTMFPEKNDYLNKVFDFVTKRVFPKHDWVNITRGFKMKSNFETSKYIITGGFEDGKTQGYFYRAWSIIFSSNNLFVPLFKDFLQDEINSQQETTLQKGDESLKNEITHPKRVEIAEAVRNKYSSFKNKDFKILYEAFLELDLFPKVRKRLTFFRCLKNEGYNINNSQMLEDQHFKESTTTKNGNYLISDDEKQKNEIVQYLKTIINPK
jgi:hypothetical protein